ncbi:MAG: 5'-methylthioadenosine/S-adenosylhomocysteine nucleosidase [Chloroflexota bacterium]|nr:5'-methylthioadenosine/S-adenosylhomocysteine nucleosidase [Chloroflexota bacterium]MDQ5864385.1 5'-methylthioadenosine/S-adenosylhomocysteine nucleosidase [Chloroflexota bacterium]
MSKQSTGHPVQSPVDFVIITALREELAAVLTKLRAYRRLPPMRHDVRIYYWSEVETAFSDGSKHKYNVIVFSLLGMGRVEAANATNDAIKQWRPRYILLVGIAGGLAVNNVKLGDILVSDQVVDYELQKLTDEGPEVRYNVYRVDPRMLGASQHLESDQWLKFVSAKRPSKGLPSVIQGPIATGDKVVAFETVLERYRSAWPRLVGVEMEAGGAASAVLQRDNPPGFFMVRGVSDLADEEKNSPRISGWRPYATDIAAAYAVALLQSGPTPIARSTTKSAKPPTTVATSMGQSVQTDLPSQTISGSTETHERATRQESITEVEATIIHIEDLESWREVIKEVIEEIGRFRFRTFISKASLEDIAELETIVGPVILLMDLRLETPESNYSGYRWLLEDWRYFQARNHSVGLFVISGHLNEAIKETLLYQGIPENHIYDKGQWVTHQDRFLDALREVVEKIDVVRSD